MKFLKTSTMALALLASSSPLIASELNVKTGYITVFSQHSENNNNKPIFAAGYEAQIGGMSVIVEGGITYGANDLTFSANAQSELVEHTEISDDFQFVNILIPYKTKLQEKELTFSAGPSLVTYQSTLYSVNSDNTGYTPTTTQKFDFGLSTEMTLNLLKTQSFGVDVYSTLPINFHSNFGAGFSFGAKLGVEI